MFDDLANRQIGDFIVQERLGRGAMSVVYRAVQQSVNRSVAFKVINLNLNPLAKENYQPYFIQEAKVIATLEHIHIVPIYNYGPVDEESSFIVLRLLRGGSVADLIHEGTVDLYRVLDIFIQTGQGLAHAHGRGIIHRDLKPSNILLDDLGNAYLTDFGLGKLAEVSLDLTESGNVIGTPLYASPEQILGDEIDHRSDIYSLCAIMYHMLAGCPPLDIGDGGLIELIQKHMHETPIPLREIDPGIPSAVGEAIMRGLSRSPADRPQSIEALAEALNVTLGRRISRSSEMAAVTTTGEQPSASPSDRRALRWWWLATALLVAILALSVGLTWLASRQTGRVPQTLVVLHGEQGALSDVVPSPEEVAAAKELLGSRSFVAYIACTLENEFQLERAEYMAERLDSYGINFQVYDSRMDYYRQLAQIERARVDGAKALILCVLTSSSLNSSLEAASQAGIPLVFLTPQEAHFGGVVLDGSHYDLGMAAGRYIASLANATDGGSRVLLLEYAGWTLTEQRAAGIVDALAEQAPQAQIVERSNAVTVAQGQRVVDDLLERGVAFDMIAATTDAAALGAARALELAGVDPSDVAIVSINGEDEAKAMVREGRYLVATVETDVVTSSHMAVDAAIRLLGGGAVPEFISYEAGPVYSASTAATQGP